MRYHIILPSLALLAFAGVAGAQGTSRTAPTRASSVPTAAKPTGMADTTSHSGNKARRRHRRNTTTHTNKSSATADSSTAHKAGAAPKMSAKVGTKKP
jgi:hypothetical protein